MTQKKQVWLKKNKEEEVGESSVRKEKWQEESKRGEQKS